MAILAKGSLLVQGSRGPQLSHAPLLTITPALITSVLCGGTWRRGGAKTSQDPPLGCFGMAPSELQFCGKQGTRYWGLQPEKILGGLTQVSYKASLLSGI